jgi:hypothetical protein
MAYQPLPPSPLPPSPPPPPKADWAKQTTETLGRVVGEVRVKTTGPLIKVARAVVYGLLAAILGVAALVLVAILLIRVLDLLPGGVWVAQLIAGLIFTGAGLLMWRLRHTPETV